jgi:hypothetical protein
MQGTQLNFSIFAEKKDDEKEKKIIEILYIWGNHSKKYRTYVREAETLLAEMEKLKVKHPTFNPQKTAMKWPKCRIFEFEDREELRKYLQSLTLDRLNFYYDRCELAAIDSTYRKTCAFVEDSKYKVSVAKQKAAAKEKADAFQKELEMQNKFAF